MNKYDENNNICEGTLTHTYNSKKYGEFTVYRFMYKSEKSK